MAIDPNDARCPDCGTTGYVSGLGGRSWWFACRSCKTHWGHPQAWTLNTAHDAVELSREAGASEDTK